MEITVNIQLKEDNYKLNKLSEKADEFMKQFVIEEVNVVGGEIFRYLINKISKNRTFICATKY